MSWLRFAELTPEERMKNLAEWAQDTFFDAATGKYVFKWEQVQEEGRRLGLPEHEIQEVMEDMKRIEGSRVTAGAPGDGPVTPSEKLDALLDNVPPQVGVEFTTAVEYAATIRDALLELLESELPPLQQDKYARMLGEITMAVSAAQERGQSGPIMVMIEQLKEIRKEASQVDKSMITEVFEQSLRQSSADGEKFPFWWDMALRGIPEHLIVMKANTGFTDAQATIRATFLLGQCTAELWRKAVADVKKECGPEIKKQVAALPKWGTVPPAQGAARDIVLKVLQSKGIYPYGDLVGEIMHGLGFNPWMTPEGPEKSTDFSPKREGTQG